MIYAFLSAVLAVLTAQSLLLFRLLRQNAPPSQTEPEKEVKSPVDEGFDNIMRYQVGGKNGFPPD